MKLLKILFYYVCIAPSLSFAPSRHARDLYRAAIMNDFYSKIDTAAIRHDAPLSFPLSNMITYHPELDVPPDSLYPIEKLKMKKTPSLNSIKILIKRLSSGTLRDLDLHYQEDDRLNPLPCYQEQELY